MTLSTGYNISMEDLKSFRRLHSITPGHPENTVTPGVEVSTGVQIILTAVLLHLLHAEWHSDKYTIHTHFL